MPVYNSEKNIEKSLISLITQKLSDLEFIIIDDGSTDNSLSIIKDILDKYSSHNNTVTLITRENKGVAATRAEGVKLAQGEYIIHFDSDDWVDENWLQYLYKKAIEDNADIVICDYTEVYKRKKIHIHQQHFFSKQRNIEALLTGQISNMNWDKLVRKSILTENNITYIKDLNMGEDFLVTLMMIYHSNKISHISEPLYYYNKTNQDSLTYNYSKQSLDDILNVTKTAETFLINNNYLSNVQESFDYFKLNVRAFFIIHSNGELGNIKKGLNLYPETNYLINSYNAPKILKIMFLINKHGLLFLHQPIDKLYFIYRKLRNIKLSM